MTAKIKLSNLIKAERIKNWNFKKFFIFLLIICVVNAGFVWIFNHDFIAETEEEKKIEESMNSAKDWKEKIKVQIEANKLNEEIFGAETIELTNSLLQYRLDNNIKLIEGHSAWEYVSYTINSINVIASIVLIFYATKLFIMEEDNGMESFLFSQEFSRKHVILSKTINIIITSFILLISSFIITFIFGAIFYGIQNGGLDTVLYLDGNITSMSLISSILLKFGLWLFTFLIVGIIGFLLSIIIKSSLISRVIMLVYFLFGKIISDKLIYYLDNPKLISYTFLPYNSFANFIDTPLSSDIAHVIMREFNHYVVVYELKNDQLILLDPAVGITKMSVEDFIKCWTGVLFLFEPTEKIKQVKEDKGHLSKILKLAKQEKKKLLSILFVSLLYTITGIASTMFFNVIFDKIIPTDDITKLRYAFIAFFLITILQILFQYLRLKRIIGFEKSISRSFTLSIIKKMISLPLSFFTQHQTGDLIQRLDDTHSIRNLLSGVTATLLVDMLLGIVSAIFLYKFNPTLFYISMVIFGISTIICFAFVKPIRRYFNELKSEEGNLKSLYVQSLNGIETIKGQVSETYVNKIATNQFNKVIDKTTKLRDTENKLIFFLGLIQSLGTLLILSVGVVFVVRKKMTIGTLFTFYSLFRLFYNSNI